MTPDPIKDARAFIESSYPLHAAREAARWRSLDDRLTDADRLAARKALAVIETLQAQLDGRLPAPEWTAAADAVTNP